MPTTDALVNREALPQMLAIPQEKPRSGYQNTGQKTQKTIPPAQS